MACLCGIFKFIFGLLVAVGVLLLTLGLIYTPHNLKFHVTGAELTQFDSIDNQLHYQLNLNVTIRNPNKRYRVYYDTNEVAVLYKNKRLETQWLPALFQDTKTTTVLSPQFYGQQLVILGGDELLEFDAEKAAGVYHVDVKLFLRLRLKSGGLVLKFKPKVNCGLKVPLRNIYGENSLGVFQTTDCDFKF